ncbi:hypothetical protein scyTo_0021634 [Scyliorhinus torazame]|uniref:Uncharacterized protein n=1 Tax=Scyliorhinus torazame TaxID=75743 RepID=A0A401QAY8_SCYTO|nr:hypothetical protein [Scyliorhinus torazame]
MLEISQHKLIEGRGKGGDHQFMELCPNKSQKRRNQKMSESKNQRSSSSMVMRQSVSAPAHWSMEQWVEYLDEKFARHRKKCGEDMTQAIASI